MPAEPTYQVRAYFPTRTYKYSTTNLERARFYARAESGQPLCQVAVIYAPQGWVLERYPHREEN